MSGNGITSHDHMDSHSILNKITNVEPLSSEQLTKLCVNLSNRQLKTAYQDCQQHELIIHDKARRAFYKNRCKQLIDLMVERVENKESDFDQFCSEHPNIANHIMESFIGKSSFLARIVDHPDWFNWHSEHFVETVEQAILKLPIKDRSTKSILEFYSEHTRKTHGLQHWYEWMNRVSNCLSPGDFFDLMRHMDGSQKYSIQFLNQLKQDTESQWQAFFDQLSYEQLSDDLYYFLHVAEKKKKTDLIHTCYAKTVVKKALSDETLQRLLNQLLEPTLPSISCQWIEAIITELDNQTKLKDELLVSLISELMKLNLPTVESSNALHKAIILFAKHFINSKDASLEYENNSDLAYQILVNFDSLMLIVGDIPTYSSFLPVGFNYGKNKYLETLIDKLDFKKNSARLIEEWLNQACGNWDTLIHILRAIRYINTGNGHNLLGAITHHLDLDSAMDLTAALSNTKTQEAIYESYLSPLKVAKQIKTNQLSKRLPIDIGYWQKNIAVIVNALDVNLLPKLLQYLPPSPSIIAQFWQQSLVYKKYGILLTEALQLDDVKAKLSVNWWLEQDKKHLDELMNDLLSIMEKNILPISALIRLGKLIGHYTQSTDNANSLTQAWLKACVYSVSQQEIMPHQWLKLEHTLIPILTELLKKEKIPAEITSTLTFTSLIRIQIAQTESASIAVNLAQHYPGIQLDSVIKDSPHFSQAIGHIIANTPESAISIEKRMAFYQFLSPDLQHKFASAQLAKPEWVTEHFHFCLTLTNSVDIDFIYQQIKNAANPRPYVDLLIQRPYKKGLGQLNKTQTEQVFHAIGDRAHLARLLQSDTDPDNKHHLLTQLLHHHISCNDLSNYINQLQPDLICLLLLLNYSDQKELRNLIQENQSWFDMIQKWLINPVPSIDIEPDSLLYQIVVDSFCNGRFHYLPNQLLIEQLQPADMLHAHQAIWQWRQYAQRIKKIFISEDPIVTPTIVRLINGRWVYQLDWMYRLVFPILEAYQKQPNQKVKLIMKETDLFKQIILPLSEDSIPSHDDITTLFVESQTHLRKLVEDYLEHLRPELPKHVSTLESTLRQIDSQCRQEKNMFHPSLRQLVLNMPPFKINASGQIKLEDSIELDTWETSDTETSFSLMLEHSWQQTWLNLLHKQAKRLCNEPAFAEWFYQNVFPTLNGYSFDAADLIQQLDLEKLFAFYSQAYKSLNQIEIAIPKWQTCQSATTISKLIARLYHFKIDELTMWAATAKQNNCLLLANLFSFLAEAKCTGLALTQVERLTIPSQIPNEYQMDWWQSEWGTLIKYAKSTQEKVVNQFEHALFNFESRESMLQLCKLLNQTDDIPNSKLIVIFKKFQDNQDMLITLIAQIPMEVIYDILSNPRLPYTPFMRALIVYLQTKDMPITPLILLESWSKNQWPVDACLEGMVNSKNPQLTSCLALYCLTLSDHKMLYGPSTKEALTNHTESHILAAFSQAILANELTAAEWQRVSKVGAQALLMDAHQFNALSDYAFQILTTKTESEHLHLIQRLMRSQMDRANAKVRLRQWYQFYPELTLSCIEALVAKKQTSAWLQLIDTLSSSSLSLNKTILERLPKNDSNLYVAIWERVFNSKENEHPLKQWLIEQGASKLSSTVIKYPDLVPVAMMLAKDNRFNTQLIDLNKLAVKILLKGNGNITSQRRLFEAMLKQIRWAESQLIATMARYDAEAVLTNLGKEIRNPSQLSKILQATLSYLDEVPDLKEKFDLAYKHAELEKNIKEMTGPLHWLIAWILRLWHRLWVGNSPYILPGDDYDSSSQSSDEQTIQSPFKELPEPFNQFISDATKTTTATPDAPWPKLKSALKNEARIDSVHTEKEPMMSTSSEPKSDTLGSTSLLSQFSGLFGYNNQETEHSAHINQATTP